SPYPLPPQAGGEEILTLAQGTQLGYVFTYRGRRVGRMYSSAWKRARRAAGLPSFRVHDLKRSKART
ncbi:MAG: site-specific integrase, partial [Phycisphaerae bacterium]